MDSNLLGTEVSAVLDAVLADDPAHVVVVNPSAGVLEDLIEAATERGDDLAPLRVLAVEDVLKDVMDDFLVASRAADLVAEDALSLRTAADLPRHTVMLTPETVVSLVGVGERVAGIAAGDAAFVETVTEAVDTDWAAADPFQLRTPSITAVRDTLGEEIGEEARADFDAVLASMETARGDDGDLDEVTISLLVAARNRELLYDISKWGEDVGIASKATFSRTKTKLEDLGLIDTEKVPIDVGRPRLRLRLADDRLQDADVDDVANVATSVLAG